MGCLASKPSKLSRAPKGAARSVGHEKWVGRVFVPEKYFRRGATIEDTALRGTTSAPPRPGPPYMPAASASCSQILLLLRAGAPQDLPQLRFLVSKLPSKARFGTHAQAWLLPPLTPWSGDMAA